MITNAEPRLHRTLPGSLANGWGCHGMSVAQTIAPLASTPFSELVWLCSSEVACAQGSHSDKFLLTATLSAFVSSHEIVDCNLASTNFCGQVRNATQTHNQQRSIEI